MSAGSGVLGGSGGFTPTLIQGGLVASGGSGGSHLSQLLTEVRQWWGTYVSVTDDLDLDLLTLWAAHTHVVEDLYSTPRLVIDSMVPGSGKTTVLEHMNRLAFAPIQAASLSSPAMLARMIDKGIRTILIDEADRSLDPKKPDIGDLLAILNSGYKKGATRPVLVPAKSGEWDVKEMPTFSPVVMAGNQPNLPDDTRSRCIRVLLLPDIEGRVESSDWEELDEPAADLAMKLRDALEKRREDIKISRPLLPEGCIGRMKEKWSPLARVAAAAGGDWPDIAAELIRRDLHETEIEREEGLMRVPPGVALLRDIYEVWKDEENFVPTTELISRLISFNPSVWSDASSYGKAITVQRMGRMLVAAKIRSDRVGGGDAPRGYKRSALERSWRQLGISPRERTARTAQADRTGGAA